MKNDDFNLFELLVLDPDQDWDQELFERTLASKRKEWQGQITNPRKRQRAQKNYSRIARLREIADDKVEREWHVEQSKKKKNEEKNAREKALREEIELFQAKGYLIKAELDSLAVRYLDIVSESEIRALVKVPIQEGAKKKEEHGEILDSTSFQEIERQLSLWGQESGQEVKDLYEFLDEKPESKLKELTDKANKLRSEAQKGLTNAKNTAQSQLAGYCLDIFSTEAEKKKYDKAREEALSDIIRRKMDVLFEHTQTLHLPQVQKLLKIVKTYGIEKEHAIEVIQDYARRKKWDWDIPPNAFESKNEESSKSGPSVRPFTFKGKNVYDIRELARLLASNWDEAVEEWESRRIRRWVSNDLRDFDLERAIDKIEKESKEGDEEKALFRLILALDPSGPLSFGGIELTAPRIRLMADRSGTDSRERSMLLQLLREGIIRLIGEMGKDRQLEVILKSWTDQIERYENRFEGKGDGGVPRLNSENLGRLLAAATPGSTAIDSLRKKAESVSSSEARQCSWFSKFSHSSKAEPAELLAITLSAASAEREVQRLKDEQKARERVRMEAQRQSFARLVRICIAGPSGFVVGGVVGSFFGFVGGMALFLVGVIPFAILSILFDGIFKYLEGAALFVWAAAMLIGPVWGIVIGFNLAKDEDGTGRVAVLAVAATVLLVAMFAFDLSDWVTKPYQDLLNTYFPISKEESKSNVVASATRGYDELVGKSKTEKSTEKRGNVRSFADSQVNSERKHRIQTSPSRKAVDSKQSLAPYSGDASYRKNAESDRPKQNLQGGNHEGRNKALAREEMVRSIQVALRKAGYSEVTVDGKQGPVTRQAIKKWQRQKGYPETGTLTSSQAAVLVVTTRVQDSEQTSVYKQPNMPSAGSQIAKPSTPPNMVTRRPIQREAPTGRYMDKDGCLREQNGRIVIGFKNECR